MSRQIAKPHASAHLTTSHHSRTEGKFEVSFLPLPPPDVLERYDQIHPGLAKTFAEQWERETAHRHQREIAAQRYAGRGQVFGLVVALFFGIVAAWCVYFGAETAAAVIGSVDLVGLVAVFVAGRLSRSRRPQGE